MSVTRPVSVPSLKLIRCACIGTHIFLFYIDDENLLVNLSCSDKDRRRSFFDDWKNLFGSPIPEASVPIVEMQVAEILCVLSVHRFVFSSVLHALFGGRLGSLDFEIFAWAKSKRVSSLIRGETTSLFLIICNNMYLYINCFVFQVVSGATILHSNVCI